jgi:glutamine amidotransferase-like uncharacterized protein
MTGMFKLGRAPLAARMIGSAVVAAMLLFLAAWSASAQGGATARRPLALVYRGPLSCEDCSEAAAALLRSSRWNFEVRYVGPDEALPLSATSLAGAALYVQPGGDDDDDVASALSLASIEAVRSFVRSGGRYLGFCMGGFLAGTPGFDLVDGETDEYITQKGATVRSVKPVVMPIRWRGRKRWMYFQNGNMVRFNASASGVIVVATYPNGDIAAAVSPFGRGKVGITGPHPEADASWYANSHLVNPDGLAEDLGHDLIDETMKGYAMPSGDQR